MKLRLATLDDADILLKWRNDNTTRKYCRNTRIIKTKEHLTWLKKSLKDKNRQLYIAEINNIPIGTVRTDYSRELFELSWTVAPEMRDKNIGKEMVNTIVNKLNKPIKAVIKKINIASTKIAEYVGMSFEYEENDLLFYYKK